MNLAKEKELLPGFRDIAGYSGIYRGIDFGISFR